MNHLAAGLAVIFALLATMFFGSAVYGHYQIRKLGPGWRFSEKESRLQQSIKSDNILGTLCLAGSVFLLLMAIR